MKNLKNKIGYFLGVFAILVCVAESASAEVLTFDFTGSVTSVSGTPFGLSPGIGQQVHGCTISDRITECAEDASSHGQFTSCVADLADELKGDRLITGREKDAIIHCAATAEIP
jgi:hypothetical protein